MAELPHFCRAHAAAQRTPLFLRFIGWIFGSDTGVWATLGQWLLWLVQLSVAAVFAVVSLRFSIELSGIWHQQLVARVIRHYREIPEVRLSFSEWVGTLFLGVKQVLKLSLFLLILVAASLIPGIGFMLVFVLESQLLGRDVVDVYIDELSGTENLDSLKGLLKWTPLKLGWLPMTLAFIPIAGWTMMPLVLMLQVIGFASQLEKARA